MFQTLWSPKYRSRLIALVAWVLILLSYQGFMIANELTPIGVLREMLTAMESRFWGPLLFIIFYILQPLIFFPSWLLTMAAGYIYGPVWGAVYVIFASNLSSAVAYLTGYFFGRGIFAADSTRDFVFKWSNRMRDNSFETVLVMRFLFLPYDLVSYLAGFLNIRLAPFILATILGSIPGTIAFVLFGSSIEGDFRGEKLGLNPWVLAISVGMMATSLLLWRWFSQRAQRKEQSADF